MIDAMFEQEVAPGEVVIEQVSPKGAESVSIVVSIFVHILVALTNTVSEAKIKTTIYDSETRCLV